MALKTLTQFPFFARPYQPQNHHHRPATEIRFSRWNNANAEKFNTEKRTQKQIEDELRFQKRFIAVDRIADIKNEDNTYDAGGGFTFRSTGTPSTPSRPSIPGKKSKYSKPPKSVQVSHPAFRRTVRLQPLPKEETDIKISNDGVTYVVPDAPFEFQYSYTETPKVKPLKLREPPITPFGPTTMSRPWTGRKPLNPSKKKIDFDSFKLPPPHKKGIKPVQSPGPFLPGSGPKYVQSREEILGEPLSKEEIDNLVQGSIKSNRQLNMGRDGLTHNMLDNIHALWKRRRVCKVKCKGVCTVDMDNVRQQLEEKTGGKIIHYQGGVLYLFRGRNYNYKTRPRYPLMLWKPVPPVYPRLIKKIPDSLTLEEANEMRTKGRKLIPICKLGKNGVYCNLVKNVQEAFEACELVRINCQGMNASDYKKIGAKLKELVPCVLISLEDEHILMWRGHDWKSSLLNDDNPSTLDKEPEMETKIFSSPPLEDIGKEGSVSSSYTINQPIDVNTNDDLDYTSATSLESDAINQHELESVDPLAEKVHLNTSSPTGGILKLREQAVESGSAVILDESCLDRDIVYQKVVSLAKTAPPGPVFSQWRNRKGAVENVEKQEREEVNEVLNQVGEGLKGKEVLREEGGDLGEKVVKVLERKSNNRKQRKIDFKGEIVNVVPQGTLRVDELAKLLA